MGSITIPAIALTAYTKPEDRMQALAAGFQQFLTKPIDPTELIRAIIRATRINVSGIVTS